MNLFKRIQEIATLIETLCHNADELEHTFDRIENKLEQITMAGKTVAELLTEVDAATTSVANRIQALLDQISADPSAAELAEAKAGLQAEVDRLTAMGTGGEVNPNPNP